MIPASLIANPVAAGIAALAVVGVLTGTYLKGRSDGHAVGVERTEAAHRKAYETAVAETESWRLAYTAVSRTLETSLTEARQLPEKVEPKVLVKEVVREIPVGGECRCPGFADDFGVRWNAIADRAATAGTAKAVP